MATRPESDREREQRELRDKMRDEFARVVCRISLTPEERASVISAARDWTEAEAHLSFTAGMEAWQWATKPAA